MSVAYRGIRFLSLSFSHLKVATSSSLKKEPVPSGFRKISPFGCFVKENFTKSEDEPVSSVFSRLGKQWRELSAEEKKKYEGLSETSSKERAAKFAALSHEEQQKLIEQNKIDAEERKKRKERKLKRESRPPKALTGYNLFMKEKLKQPRQDGEKQKDLMQKAVKEWRELSDQVKEKYNSCAHAANETAGKS
uniref:HMG box domain-containing protein n=1 Tax=Syphacia muris TaxID=451379 RepID=A0A0N5APY5_9BILA